MAPKRRVMSRGRGRGRKKLGGVNVMGVDRISELPDDVLVHIISDLPLSTATATSLVSRRWLHLWKYTPKLNLKNFNLISQDSPQKTLRYVNRVNSVLKLHRAPSLQEFTVDMNATKSNRHDVARWLDFAFSRRVESLHLNCHCKYLFEDALHLEEILENITLPPGIASLKVLCLNGIKASGAAIQFFLRNCPMLERLVIEGSYITSNLELVGPSSLKHLDIRPHCSRSISIKVSAPNLTFLKIDFVDTSRLFLENVPKLANVIFGCRYCNMMSAHAASHLETLTISLDRPEEPFLFPNMPNLKKLVVDDRFHVCYGYHSSFPITSFLRASPCLEEFSVEITKLHLEEGLSNVPKDGPIFRHYNLKRFKLSGFCGESTGNDRIKLVRYIVDNCVALEEIDISQCDGTRSKRALKKGYCFDVVDDRFHVATMEERETFEKNMQLQLPTHLRLRICNHSHRY